MNKRVLIAMSGGVDSSVAAALLVRQGFEVKGVTLKLTPGQCCDIGSAQAVCEHLGIPHGMLDAQAEFTDGVIQNFVLEYQQGRTPNPCIRCNEIIKFRLLLEYARLQSFDFLATGHYAQIEPAPQEPLFQLKKGVDSGKDQSYFLYRLSQAQMPNILFPLGGMRKEEVRSLARELRLPAAERPESQEICFVPGNDYRGFLKKHAPETLQAGDLVLSDGKIIGRHTGIAFFTVGQRRKLGYAAGERMYVVRIEPSSQRVVLGPLSELRTRSIVVSNAHFIPFTSLRTGMNVSVKIRYRSRSVPAVIEPRGQNEVLVELQDAAAGVCPGQAAVFYTDDIVLGGGIIEAPRQQ